ncbi:putative transcription factor interactor and regulator CCHC(Zn) family [Helianthus anomalus]
MEHMAFLTKQTKEKLALAAYMITSLNAFLASYLMPLCEITLEMNQAILTKEYGRRPMNARPGVLKDRLRCYRCYESGPFDRDCKRAPVGYGATKAAAAWNKERSMVPVTPVETSTSTIQGNSRAGRV